MLPAIKAVSCKRKDILKLELSEYLKWADAALEGFEKAAKLLYSQYIFTDRDIPYGTQLVPMAGIFAVLGDQGDNDGVKKKIINWYWCGVFGELYGSAVETRFARDLPEVIMWIKGNSEPTTIQDANFAPERLLTLRTRNSAAYKGLHALLLRDGALDFRTGDPIDMQLYFDERIDIHHIFPKGWCSPNGIKPSVYNSIVNKTPISAKTNRMIGKNPPSVYIERLQRNAQIDAVSMNYILKSHVVNIGSLRNDKFDAFFIYREEALLSRIERVMGKPIARDSIERAADFIAEYDE